MANKHLAIGSNEIPVFTGISTADNKEQNYVNNGALTKPVYLYPEFKKEISPLLLDNQLNDSRYWLDLNNKGRKPGWHSNGQIGEDKIRFDANSSWIGYWSTISNPKHNQVYTLWIDIEENTLSESTTFYLVRPYGTSTEDYKYRMFGRIIEGKDLGDGQGPVLPYKQSGQYRVVFESNSQFLLDNNGYQHFLMEIKAGSGSGYITIRKMGLFEGNIEDCPFGNETTLQTTDVINADFYNNTIQDYSRCLEFNKTLYKINRNCFDTVSANQITRRTKLLDLSTLDPASIKYSKFENGHNYFETTISDMTSKSGLNLNTNRHHSAIPCLDRDNFKTSMGEAITGEKNKVTFKIHPNSTSNKTDGQDVINYLSTKECVVCYEPIEYYTEIAPNNLVFDQNITNIAINNTATLETICNGPTVEVNRPVEEILKIIAINPTSKFTRELIGHINEDDNNKITLEEPRVGDLLLIKYKYITTNIFPNKTYNICYEFSTEQEDIVIETPQDTTRVRFDKAFEIQGKSTMTMNDVTPEKMKVMPKEEIDSKIQDLISSRIIHKEFTLSNGENHIFEVDDTLNFAYGYFYIKYNHNDLNTGTIELIANVCNNKPLLHIMSNTYTGEKVVDIIKCNNVLTFNSTADNVKVEITTFTHKGWNEYVAPTEPTPEAKNAYSTFVLEIPNREYGKPSTVNVLPNHKLGQFEIEGSYHEDKICIQDNKIEMDLGTNEFRFNKKKDKKYRYIRCCMNKNSGSTWNYWSEIQVFDSANNLISKDKTVTTNFTPDLGNVERKPTFILTDNAISKEHCACNNIQATVQVDLGDLYDLSHLMIYHYVGHEKTIFGSEYWASKDGVHWILQRKYDLHGDYDDLDTGTRIDIVESEYEDLRFRYVKNIFDKGAVSALWMAQFQVFDLEGNNIATQADVTCIPETTNLQNIFDNNFSTYITIPGNHAEVTLDFKKPIDISHVRISNWEKVTYPNNRVLVSKDGIVWHDLVMNYMGIGEKPLASANPGWQANIIKNRKDYGKIRYIRDWIGGSSIDAYNYWLEIQAYDHKGNNIALNKPVSCSNTGYNAGGSAPASIITNGDTKAVSAADHFSTYTSALKDCVTVDLQGLYDINMVKVWHWHADNRMFYWTRTEVSADGKNWMCLRDFLSDGAYSEHKDGMAMMVNKKPTKIDNPYNSKPTRKVRYIKDWANGCVTNTSYPGWINWNEIQAIDSNGINVAFGKKSITSSISLDGKLSVITDGNKLGKNEFGQIVCIGSPNSTGPNHVLLDLGEVYDLTEVLVSHYGEDNRYYMGTKTEVSEDGQTWYTIRDCVTDGWYYEPKEGLTIPVVRESNPINKDILPQYKFIRDWCGYNTINNYAHWMLFNIFDENGNRITQNAKITESVAEYQGRDVNKVLNQGIDRGVNSVGYASDNASLTFEFNELTKISRIEIFNSPTRVHRNTKLEASIDGTNWVTIYDCLQDGTVYQFEPRLDKRVYDFTKMHNRRLPINRPNNKIRYIRDTAKNSSLNAQTNWLEIQAIDFDGNNKALNKPVTLNFEPTIADSFSSTSAGVITDGVTSSGPSTLLVGNTNPKPTVTIDLLEPCDIDKIKIYRFCATNYDRRYLNVLTEVSLDGIKWYPIYSSLKDGDYLDTLNGKTIELNLNTATEVKHLDISEINKNIDANKKYRYIRDWCENSTAGTGNHWVDIKAFDKHGNNVALKKPVTSNGTLTNIARVTDGDTTRANFATGQTNLLQYVEIDLLEEFEIDSVRVWHYGDGRKYNKTKTELAPADKSSWDVLYDSDFLGTYTESDSGMAFSTKDMIKKTRVNNKQIRFIKDTINGNNENNYSHWIEIKAYDKQGNNVALSKPAFCTSTLLNDSNVGAYNDPSMVTNGVINNNELIATNVAGLNSVIVDLQDYYELDNIRVWHYYKEGITRIYNNHKLEVSNDGVHWDTISIHEPYEENKEGKEFKIQYGYSSKNININKNLEVESIDSSIITNTMNLDRDIANIISNSQKTSTIINSSVSNPESEYAPAKNNNILLFDQPGYQKILVPISGTYRLECWGQKGGNGTGGAGGYAKGDVYLRKGTELHININFGGGAGVRPGGGASDIRIGENDLYARVIVAGGGGAGNRGAGGIGGGVTGGTGGKNYGDPGTGGTQSSPGGGRASGKFGYGADGSGGVVSGGYYGGGGGGWFGGGSNSTDGSGDDDSGAGGGSGYVFTKDSWKPSNFKLTEQYYLSNTTLTGGVNNTTGKVLITMLSDLSSSVTIAQKGESKEITCEEIALYEIIAVGANGGNTLFNKGGEGSIIRAKCVIEKGTVLFLNSSTAGTSTKDKEEIALGGINGGGNGTNGTDTDLYYQIASGGGSTDIRINNNELTSRILVAAGGGGAGAVANILNDGGDANASSLSATEQLHGTMESNIGFSGLLDEQYGTPGGGGGYHGGGAQGSYASGGGTDYIYNQNEFFIDAQKELKSNSLEFKNFKDGVVIIRLLDFIDGYEGNLPTSHINNTMLETNKESGELNEQS